MTSLRLSRISPQLLAFVAFFAVVVVYPQVVTGRFERGAGITIGALAVGTVGFVLLMGYTHQLALGQAAFYMIGGYGTAILTAKRGWDPLLAMLASMVIAMVLAYIVGWPTLKLRGFNLAMASLASHLGLIILATELKELTGGALGTTGVPRFSALGWDAGDDVSFFYVVWLFVAISIIVGLNIDRSRIGRALRAIAASETAATSVAIDATKYKVQMFVMSAGMGSVSGSLIAHYVRIMEPHAFGFQFSLNIITAVIIGGLSSIWGGALGAAIIVGLREGIRNFNLPLYEVVFMGILIVIVLMAFPQGLAGAFASLYQRLVGPRRMQANGTPQLATDGGSPHLPAQTEVLIPHMYDRRDGDGPLLVAEGVTKRFGRLVAVNEVSFSVEPHSITALIGPNGAGKTTLFNLISGHLPLDSGKIQFDLKRIEHTQPHRIAHMGLGRTFQNLQLFANLTVLENVMAGRHRKASSGLADVSMRLPNVGREERDIREAAQLYLAFVGLDGTAERSPAALPFGHQRLLEIARALAMEPRLLIMDEPASGLNDTETERMAELIMRIRALGTTVLLVEHDMRLVMGLADHVIVLNYGQKIAEGSTDEVRANPDVVAAYLGS